MVRVNDKNGAPKGLIAISPKGERVWFKSQAAASRALGCSESLVSRAKMYGRIVAGWEFTEDDGKPCSNREAVDLTTFAAKRAEEYANDRRLERKPKKPRDPEEDARQDALRRRVPGHRYSFGYYDLEYGPTICPVCGQLVKDGKITIPETHQHTTAALYHFAKCLKGRKLVREFGGVLRLDLDEPETGTIDINNIFHN